MSSVNKKKEPERLSVMVPRDCKTDIDYIIAQTGIKSNGELFKLMLARYKDDFVTAYNQFFNPCFEQERLTLPLEEKRRHVIASEPKPLTDAMSF